MPDSFHDREKGLKKLLSVARLLAHGLGDREVDGVHLFAALNRFAPEAIEAQLTKRGRSPEFIERLLDEEGVWLNDIPGEPSQLGLGRDVVALFDKLGVSEGGGKDAVDLDAMVSLLLEQPSARLQHALEQLESEVPPEAPPTEPVPFESTAEYLRALQQTHQIRQHAQQMAMMDDLNSVGHFQPAAVRAPHLLQMRRLRRFQDRSVLRATDDFSKRCSRTISERVFPVTLHRRHGLTALEGHIMDAECLHEVFGLGSGRSPSVLELAQFADSAGYPRNAATVIEAVERLWKTGLLCLQADQTPDTVRLRDRFILSHRIAKELYQALANDPLSDADIWRSLRKPGDPDPDSRRSARW